MFRTESESPTRPSVFVEHHTEIVSCPWSGDRTVWAVGQLFENVCDLFCGGGPSDYTIRGLSEATSKAGVEVFELIQIRLTDFLPFLDRQE